MYTVYPVWTDIYCPITLFLFRQNMEKTRHTDRGEAIRGEPLLFNIISIFDYSQR